MSALDDWRDALATWALPDEILTKTRRSPWEFPWELFRRRAEAALDAEPTPSAARALEALPGTILDVGAGPGAAGLAVARRADHVTAVDQSEEALAIFEEIATRAAISHDTLTGTWPDVAAHSPVADVVVCNHVLYNVPDLEPFVQELTAHGRRRVVCEITARHPRAEINVLWKRLHDLDRPTQPVADVAEAAIAEVGLSPRRENWTLRLSPEPRGELLERLLVELALEPEQEPDLVAALGEELREVEGGWTVGSLERNLVTLWWEA